MSTQQKTEQEQHEQHLLAPSPPLEQQSDATTAEEDTRNKSEYLVTVHGRGLGRPWMAVAGACVAMLGLGAQSTWSTLSIYVSAPGLLAAVPSTDTIWCYATAGSVSPVSMMLAPQLHRRIGFAATALFSVLLAGGGLIAAAFSRSLWALILTFGVAFGFGNGLVYNSCVVAAQSWFPRRRGAIGGAVLACYAGGAFVYNLLIKRLANPNNIPTRPPDGGDAEAWADLFHAEMIAHVPTAFLCLGGLTAGLGVIGSFFIHPSPSSDPRRQRQASSAAGVALEPVGAKVSPAVSPEVTPRTSIDIAAAETKTSLDIQRDPLIIHEQMRNQLFEKQLRTPAADFTPKKMMQTPQFYLLYIVLSFGVTATMLVLGSFADFAKREASFIAPFALVGGLAALSNAAGRLCWGALADLIDYRRTMVIDLTALTALLFAYFSTRTNVYFWAAATCLIWFCYGGLLALLPTMCADAFGTKHQATNYGILYTSLAIGSIVQALLLTTLLSVLGSYRSLFWIAGGLAFLADLGMVAYKPPNKGKWFAIWLSYKRT